MAWLNPNQFDLTFPQGEIISVGDNSEVYRSGDYVIKIFDFCQHETNMESGLKEIDVYSRIRHPCISELFGWTNDQSRIKLAIGYGIPIKQAYQQQLITLNQMIEDILSAEIGLQELNICHNDIKSPNIIYRNGHLQLIDFGNASDLIFLPNTVLIHNPVYPEIHRDPSIQVHEPADIRVELYAIATTLMAVIGEYDTDSLNDYPLTRSKYPIIQDMVMSSVTERPYFQDFFRKYPELKLTQGVIIRRDGPRITIDEHWINQLTQNNNILVRGNALELARVSIPLIDPERKYIQLISSCCVLICQQLNDNQNILSMAELSNILDVRVSVIREVYFHIVRAVQGIVSFYQWTAE